MRPKNHIALIMPRTTSVKPKEQPLSTVLLLLLLGLFLGSLATLTYLWYAVSSHPSMLKTLTEADTESVAFEFKHPVLHDPAHSPNTAAADELATATPQHQVFDAPVDDFEPQLPLDPRRDTIKQAFLHAWNGYVECAWGMDELKPVSCKGKNSFGLGLQIIDALSTLHIMGLDKEFKRARDWVATELNLNAPFSVSVFETTIRVLGGLLSAYDLSNDQVFLDKARECGDKLIKAFDPTSGIPYPFVHLQTGARTAPGWHSGHTILSELGTLQLEFVSLSYHTNDMKYAEKAIGILNQLLAYRASLPAGFLPNKFSLAGPLRGKGSQVSMGALGDSYYEYLLKLWIFAGKQHPKLETKFSEVASSILTHLYKKTNFNGAGFVAEFSGSRATTKMDHLACFSGGMLRLGASCGIFADSQLTENSANAAAGIAVGCMEMYRRQPSKLAPEAVSFQSAKLTPHGGRYYLSRPETVETLMYLYRLGGGEEKYRDMGFEIFEAMEKQTKTKHGYSGVSDVTRLPVHLDDTMQTFLLAETFKYLYLLYSPENVLPLDQYVFNTEAHPLRILQDKSNGVFSVMKSLK